MTLANGCVAEPTAEPEVLVTAQALGACDETVPANRNVDGIPAYAQCTMSENSAIYSNNGIDTSLTQQGSDWVKTQWSGGYQCTELAQLPSSALSLRQWPAAWPVLRAQRAPCFSLHHRRKAAAACQLQSSASTERPRRVQRSASHSRCSRFDAGVTRAARYNA
jgi:hypothetical protein